MSDTPITTAEHIRLERAYGKRSTSGAAYRNMYATAEQLELKLATVTVERDALRKQLRALIFGKSTVLYQRREFDDLASVTAERDALRRQLAEVRTALADSLSIYGYADVLVAAERIEAWERALGSEEEE